jgi:SAM-dependent methyltransferase
MSTIAAFKPVAKRLLGHPTRSAFLRQMPKHAVCAEIGVFRGEYSREILRIARPRELHLIDGWWTLYGERFPEFWGEYSDHGRLTTRQAYDETVAAISEHPGAKIHVGDDLEILATFPDAYFDWVYLDSSHLYEHTLKELALLKRKVKSDGIIVGDDFTEDPSDCNHGCAVAIREFCEAEGWEVAEVDAFRQWRLTR